MNKDPKKYILRKVRKNTWSGVDRFSDTKEGIAANIDNQGLPITGLTEDTVITNEKGHKEVVKGTRTLIEEALGVDPGYLKRGTTIKHSEFWVQYAVELRHTERKFDTSIPEDWLAVEFLKAQKQVAFGNSNIDAYSEYLLYSPEDAAVVANKSNKGKIEANKVFASLTIGDKKEVLEMFGIKAESLSVDEIESKLYDELQEFPAKFLLFVNDPTRKQQAFIRSCLDRGILHLDNGSIMYNATLISYDVPNAAIKLFSEEHATTLEAIKLQISPKTKVDTKTATKE